MERYEVGDVLETVAPTGFESGDQLDNGDRLRYLGGGFAHVLTGRHQGVRVYILSDAGLVRIREAGRDVTTQESHALAHQENGGLCPWSPTTCR